MQSLTNSYSDLHRTLTHKIFQERIWGFRCKDAERCFEETMFGCSLIPNDPSSADRGSSTLLGVLIP